MTSSRDNHARSLLPTGGQPWEVLGIPRTASREEIVGALRSGLAAIETHAMSRTPEGEDARMALHAAASAMLSPPVSSPVSSQVSSGVVPIPLAMSIDPSVRRAIASALVRGGGVTTSNIRSLGRVLAASGVAVSDLPRFLRALIQSGARTTQSQDGMTNTTRARPVAPSMAPPSVQVLSRMQLPVPPPLPERELIVGDARRAIARDAIVLGGLLAIGLASILGIGWFLYSRAMAPASTDPVVVAPEPDTIVDDRVSMEPDAIVAVPVMTTEDAAREFMAMCRDLTTRSNSAPSLVSVVDVIGRGWWTLPPDQLAAVQSAAVDAIYREQSDHSLLTALAIGEPDAGGVVRPEWLSAAVWKSVLLSRLASERDLPVTTRDRVHRAAGPIPFASIPAAAGFIPTSIGVLAGAGDWLVSLVGESRVVDVQPAWSRWIEIVNAMTAETPTERERLVLGALDRVLTTPRAPANEVSGRMVVSMLATSMTWREGEASREWLLGVITAPGASVPDLSELTRTIVSGSADGVDPTMTLLPNADSSMRSELRDRFALAWGVQSAGASDELTRRWQVLSQQWIEKSPPENPGEAAAHLATMARLATAGCQLASGGAESPASIIEDPAQPIDAVTNAISARPDRSDALAPGDTTWAVKYIAAENNAAERLALMLELSRTSAPPGAVAAELVMATAVRGSPQKLRKTARDLAERWGDEPAAINAAIELIPTLPATRENSDLIRRLSGAQLPPLGDASWRTVARRALVERLLELLAGSGDDSLIDQVESIVSVAYDARVASAVPGRKVGSLIESAAKWRASLERDASRVVASGREPMSLAEIQRRASARAAATQGLVQGFVAVQSTCVELLGFVVATERPRDAATVAEIVTNAFAERRSTVSVLGQAIINERAILKLLTIRLGVEEAA